jgi:hypothetical protein
MTIEKNTMMDFKDGNRSPMAMYGKKCPARSAEPLGGVIFTLAAEALCSSLTFCRT